MDPLTEQMRSILQFGPRASDLSQRRERRFSDADRPFLQDPLITPEPIAIRSRDGSRWLPAPDEQLHRYATSSSSNCDHVHPPPSRTIEPHSCPSAICAIAKVFETTELLELILSFLETKDVLSSRRISRQWDTTIHQSPQLRLHFFTYGQWSRPGAQFEVLPLSLPGLTVKLGKEIHLGRWIELTFTPEAARRIAPDPRPNRRVRSRSIFEGLRGGLGLRTQKSSDSWPASKATPTISSTLQYEDLFIIQPPLLGMQAFIVYENTAAVVEEDEEGNDTGPDFESRACAKLWCDAGVTLGFLAETAQSLLSSQKDGPSNLGSASVVFKAIISFCAAEDAPKKRRNTRSVTPLQ